MIQFLEKWETDHEAKMTPMEQQLHDQREDSQRRRGKSCSNQ